LESLWFGSLEFKVAVSRGGHGGAAAQRIFLRPFTLNLIPYSFIKHQEPKYKNQINLKSEA
jgi:hypothetical protein